MLENTCCTSAVGRHRIESALQDVFGVSFDVSEHTPGTTLASANSTDEVTWESHAGFFLASNGAGGFDIRFTRLVRSDHVFDATGTVDGSDKAAVVRAATCAVRMINQDQQIEEQNQQLEYFIQQVSSDLEETCWFRTMAEQVAACRADDPVEELCNRILPQLRSLLIAKSVIVIQQKSVDDYSMVALDSDTEDQSLRSELAFQLVRQYGDRAAEKSFVWNSEFSTDHLDCSEGGLPGWLDGFVLVRIGTDRQHFGWLLALERRDAVGAVAQSRGSESEFGTHEATLMETAAVLLMTHASNCELFEEQEKTLVGVVTAMVNALDARDPYTRGHSHRVALISQRISQQLGMSDEEVEDIYLSGLLHDVGKIGVADHVLLKNGPLDTEERRQIQQHTVIGHAILSPVKQLGKVLPGVLHHHEQMDGSGYPSQLKGENIPLAGRILAVADAYDAMTTCRPYRNAMPIETAEQILLEGAGTHWDERMIDAFFAVRADIRQLYDNAGEAGGAAATSSLQFGRFEDVSLAAVAQLSSSGLRKV